MLQLTSDVFNDDGLNVVDLAIVVGAATLLNELLNIPEVYRFRQHDGIVYDITYLAPRTTPHSRPVSAFGRLKSWKKTSVVPVTFVDGQPSSAGSKSATSEVRVSFVTDSTIIGGHPRTSKSCLDLIVEMEDEIAAARILDVSPFRQLVQNYWKTYQWLYGTLMLLHIIYMIIYTIHVLPDSTTLIGVYNTTGTQSCRSLPQSDLFGLFLIWPSLVLAVLVYYAVSTACWYQFYLVK